MKRTPSTLLAAAAWMALAGPARAQETGAQRADRLFNEANQLADHGDFASACPRYDESNRLDPAIGTQFNLADCYEHTGRTGSALLEFREVERIASIAGKADRQKSAHLRADALEKTVPRIQIVVPASLADAPGLDVRCDEKPVARADYGKALPLDPGQHTLTAKAPGRMPWSQTVQLSEHQNLSVPMPELAAVAGPQAGPPPRARSRVLLAGVSGGVGIAGVLVGSVTGVISIIQHSKYTSDCPKGSPCSNPNGVDESHLAVAMGNASTIGFVIGGVGLATGAVLFFTAPRESQQPATALRIVPAVGPGSASLSIGASF
jgi:hypothetical protein